MANPEFTHWLVTRFNVKVTNFGPEKLDSSVVDPELMEQRLRLFEEYCFPSVLSQTTKNFTWMIFLDTNTDAEYLRRLDKILESASNVQKIKVDDFQGMLAFLRNAIQQAPAPYVMTSRLDNDDMISKDYIETAQKIFKPVHRMVLNFVTGFELDLEHRYIKYWSDRPKNQFISLIEDRSKPDLLSIYGFPHYSLPEDATLIDHGGGPKWIYTRHAYNYSAQKINARPVFSTKVLKDFPSLTQWRISFVQSGLYAIKWFMKYAIPILKRKLKR